MLCCEIVRRLESARGCAVVCGEVLWYGKKKGSLRHGHAISVLCCTVEVSVKGVFCKAVGSRVVVVSTPVFVCKSLCQRLFQQ